VDREHVKGAADKTKGAIKDTVGKVTGDKELQTEGKWTRQRAPPTKQQATSKTPFVKLENK
jgi:uncharacterized protein YjbJ (UPF0337 family)